MSTPTQCGLVGRLHVPGINMLSIVIGLHVLRVSMSGNHRFRSGWLAMPSHSHKKFRWGTVFATGCRSFIEPGLGHRMKRTNRRTQVPIDLYPCHIEKKMIMKKVMGESVMEWKTKVTTKEGTVIKFPGKFRGIKLATEEEAKENEELKEV
ncbi:hypothetical protein Tco_0305351 [Tanacetum coccineum]